MDYYLWKWSEAYKRYVYYWREFPDGTGKLFETQLIIDNINYVGKEKKETEKFIWNDGRLAYVEKNGNRYSSFQYTDCNIGETIKILKRYAKKYSEEEEIFYMKSGQKIIFYTQELFNFEDIPEKERENQLKLRHEPIIKKEKKYNNFCTKCGSIEKKLTYGLNICIDCYREQEEEDRAKRDWKDKNKDYEISEETEMEDLAEENPYEIEELRDRGLSKRNIPQGELVNEIICDYLKERKKEEKMKNYYNTIDEINKVIKKYKIKKVELSEKMGISKQRISQILNKKRESNGGEILNLLSLTGFKYKFE